MHALVKLPTIVELFEKMKVCEVINALFLVMHVGLPGIYFWINLAENESGVKRFSYV